MRATALLAALVIVAAPLNARAVTVQTVSARQLEGKLTAIAAGHLEIEVGGKTVRVPLEKVFRIVVRDHVPVRDRTSRVEIRTVGGACLHGSLARSRRPLSVVSPALGKALHLGTDDVLGLRFAREKGLVLTPARFEDELAVTNRETDSLFVITPKGIVPFGVAVERVTPRKVLYTWDGQDRSIDTERVAAIVFANPPAEDPAPAVVSLTDASVLRGNIISSANGKLWLDMSGTRMGIALARVLSVEITSSDVAYLSDLRPARVREIPFFNHVWKYRLDRSVFGNPLTLDGRKYARGLGCHTKTMLTYDLGGRFGKFVAVIGIDDEARPGGSVRFIVEADGKQVFAADVTGRDKAVPVAVDIENVKKLTLTADFSSLASVGDHADWADARVMK